MTQDGQEVLRARALGESAITEYLLREEGESAHQSFIREAVHRARRRALVSAPSRTEPVWAQAQRRRSFSAAFYGDRYVVMKP